MIANNIGIQDNKGNSVNHYIGEELGPVRYKEIGLLLNLNDNHLLASYNLARELELDKAFIELLEKELIKRGIVFQPQENDRNKS
ncbi:sporulation histidine kinase inhibitor Sda [Paenibacillus sp. M.A.Huq-84]